jgi:uncharacterized protein YjbI with pentapeptide repeats
MIGVNLSGASLTNILQRFYYWPGANLSGANLTGVDLTRSDLTRSDLTHVIWVDATCPNGSPAGRVACAV